MQFARFTLWDLTLMGWGFSPASFRKSCLAPKHFWTDLNTGSPAEPQVNILIFIESLRCTRCCKTQTLYVQTVQTWEAAAVPSCPPGGSKHRTPLTNTNKSDLKCFKTLLFFRENTILIISQGEKKKIQCKHDENYKFRLFMLTDS